MNQRILNVGSAAFHYVCKVPTLPKPNTEITITDDSMTIFPCGRALLSSIAIARSGSTAAPVFSLGKDLEGQMIYTLCKEEQVDTSFITVDSRMQTGKKLLLQEGTQAPRIINYPGANLLLSKQMISQALSTSIDCVLLHMDTPEELFYTTLVDAYNANIPVVINGTKEGSSYTFTGLPKIDILFLDDEATEVYTGIRPNGADQGLMALLALSSKIKAQYYIIYLKERGVLLFDGRHYQLISPFLVKPVDFAGTNETFIGCLSSDFIENKNITHAVQYAFTAAALAMTKPGAHHSIPRKNDILEYGKANRIW